MSKYYSAEAFARTELTRKVSPFQVNVVRSFDIPPVLHGLTVGLYLAFLAVMAFAFQDRNLIIPMVIFVGYIVMAFGVPAMWVRMAPGHGNKTISWADYKHLGINTYTGNMSATDAAGQILILPVLIFVWAVAIALIAAVVR